MEASILIVSKDRKAELEKTLSILEDYIQKEHHEVRVFLDGSSDGSDDLKRIFPWVHWYSSEKTMGASKARNLLYQKAEGEILFGFDDDAHPLQEDFIHATYQMFEHNKNLGIIGFREIKGIYGDENLIPEELLVEEEDFLSNDFLGCGFAIKKEVYDRTRGFPVWIDIYGEEVCLAWETLRTGKDILFTGKVRVNHRVDRKKRKSLGANYFRFNKQLKNTTYFYLVYYPFPLLLKKILKLWLHNFRKYALRDMRFFTSYFSAIGEATINLNRTLRYRQPVTREFLNKISKLRNPDY